MTLPGGALLLSLLSAQSAFAAGGGGHHGAPHVANWWGLGSEWAHAPALGWLSITFLIFVALLYRAISKPLGNYIEHRSNEVKNALEEAAKAKAEAEARVREYEERLSKLDTELEELKSDFRVRGESEMKRLETAGKRASDRILKDAEDTIAAEFDKAQHSLKLEASRLALEVAEEKIRKAVVAADHQRLEKSFVADVAQ
jgi:F-type H+-transporting ATPase subunit b